MDRGSILRVWLPLVVGLLALGALYRDGPGPHDWLRQGALVLGLTGLAGVIFARYNLGRSFSITPKATALVTGGIYSRIRNPMYVSAVILVTGVFLMLRQPALWLLLLIVVPMQTIRARQEARVLEATVGDAYREYRRRTWF